MLSKHMPRRSQLTIAIICTISATAWGGGRQGSPHHSSGGQSAYSVATDPVVNHDRARKRMKVELKKVKKEDPAAYHQGVANARNIQAQKSYGHSLAKRATLKIQQGYHTLRYKLAKKKQ